MSSKKPVLTSQELEIMKVVWKSGASTVRDVYETLLEHRKIAYTTVMTMMNILEQKGHLKKAQKDRAYVYQATRPQKQVIRGMVREFVDRVFNGLNDFLNRVKLDGARLGIHVRDVILVRAIVLPSGNQHGVLDSVQDDLHIDALFLA